MQNYNTDEKTTHFQGFMNAQHAECVLLKAVRNSLTSPLFEPDTGRLKNNFRSSNLHLNTPDSQ